MGKLPPGSTIGILGGGQLGRMLAMAAAQLGYRCHIYAPEADSVAAEVAADFTCADYPDTDALARFAVQCDVLTYEFENVPVAPLKEIAGIAPLFPGIKALEIAQSRVDEKKFIRALGGETAPFAYAGDRDSLGAALASIGAPAIAKTNRMGYDGKGQVRISGGESCEAIWDGLSQMPAIIEGFVDFSAEFSVIAARGQDGAMAFWDSPHNVHRDGILHRSTLPALPVILEQQAAAQALTARTAQALDYVGVMTCEFFACTHGPVFNEIAPRVHNSGHWTVEGALTSQFENHIRAICGLPLGDTRMAAAQVSMTNLIGAEADAWTEILSDPANHLHLYGKGESRPGRKMGHVTRLG